ncbi:hypothetical protein H632_c17p5 [Helicosporidium sp. ATCC 50920]|nr:hypothetical protein H632_c17p5 [Helicosporidium sp. ATCC 50920]|eukprot:KDD77113.1 hypothetical protein H632_c17p5 [Helicosporidium sp. ATCC 50920]
MPWAPLAEPILKIAMPLFAVCMELYLDHHGQYRYLYCPPGSKWAGRFAMPHLHNWQHASSYPAVILSGVVDLLAHSLPLPPGAPRAALGFSFGVMALLMGTHAKHEPLDAAVHWLLFVSMLAVTASLALEALLPRAPMVGVAKSAALILLGAWMWRIGAIMFEHRVQWSSDYMGGAMIAPAGYVWVAVLVSAAALLAYLAALASLDRGWLPEPPQDGEDRHPEQCGRSGGVGRPPPSGMRAEKGDKDGPICAASSEGAAAAPPVACTVAGLPLYSRRRQDSGASADIGSPGNEYSRLCSQRSEAHA